MLATLSGDLCLLVGLGLLLLPLLAVPLSRPRDGVWGALVLVLGLVLVTTSDRLRGAPMLAVLCSALLIGRLGVEVSQSRWNALSGEEQQQLNSKEYWTTSIQQLVAAIATLGGGVGSVVQQLKPAKPAAGTTKKWVRPDNPADQPGESPADSAAEITTIPPSTDGDTVQTATDPSPAPAEPEPED
ncbi:MAG: Ycf66 family protein [Synechococcus sp.]